jgi:hypothetical protein
VFNLTLEPVNDVVDSCRIVQARRNQKMVVDTTRLKVGAGWGKGVLFLPHSRPNSAII